jgi:Asp-tRNA(Asn)/Glu-tRNA(Gln) amidotransferase C subunit
VITYIDQFQRLDLMSVGPIAPSARGANRLDDDAPEPTLANSDRMRSVRDTMEPLIKVPKVLGEGEVA